VRGSRRSGRSFLSLVLSPHSRCADFAEPTSSLPVDKTMGKPPAGAGIPRFVCTCLHRKSEKMRGMGKLCLVYCTYRCTLAEACTGNEANGPLGGEPSGSGPSGSGPSGSGPSGSGPMEMAVCPKAWSPPWGVPTGLPGYIFSAWKQIGRVRLVAVSSYCRRVCNSATRPFTWIDTTRTVSKFPMQRCARSVVQLVCLDVSVRSSGNVCVCGDPGKATRQT